MRAKSADPEKPISFSCEPNVMVEARSAQQDKSMCFRFTCYLLLNTLHSVLLWGLALNSEAPGETEFCVDGCVPNRRHESRDRALNPNLIVTIGELRCIEKGHHKSDDHTCKETRRPDNSSTDRRSFQVGNSDNKRQQYKINKNNKEKQP